MHRINYCGGDVWFGRGGSYRPTTTHFNGKHSELPALYEKLINDHQVTDIILFGDCRPIHITVPDLAKKLGVRCHVFEEGYTRPNWITFEENGTNDNSPLPRNKQAIKEREKELLNSGVLPDKTEYPVLPAPLGPRVRMDLMFHLSNIILRPFFYRYITHRPERVSDELKGWINRFLRKRAFQKENAATLERYTKNIDRFFLAPLQLNSDFQIRNHSNYDGVPDFIDEVIGSFAQHAPEDSRLLFKSHPLDNGMIDYRNFIQLASLKYGLKDRVDYLEGGDLDKLLNNTEGVVLINSTVGYAALKQNAPVKVLGRAIYDMEGLTSQLPLDEFWQNAKAPDTLFINSYRRVIRADSQLYGDFFTHKGIELAATAAAKKILSKAAVDV